MTIRKSGFLGLVLAAFVLTACGDDPVIVPPPDIEVSVVPEAATIAVAGTTQLTAVVTGTTNQAVTWATGNAATATVSATGLVTGVAAGTVAITATSVEDATAADASAITVNPGVEPSIVITGVTQGGTTNPVNTQNVRGQIDVLAELSVPTGALVQRVEFLLDNGVLANCTQTFSGAGAGEISTEESQSAVQIICSVDTAAFAEATGVPAFANGPHTVSARVVKPNGTVAANVSQNLAFNNTNFIVAKPVFSKPCVNSGTSSLAPGTSWCGGTVKFTMQAVIFGAATERPNTYTVTLATNGNGSNGTAGCVTTVNPPACGVANIVKSTAAGTDTVTFVGGTVTTTSTADIAAVEDIIGLVTISSVTAGGQAGPACVNPDPANNPLGVCGTGAGGGTALNVAFFQNPLRIDNLPPRVTLFDVTAATLGCAPALECYVNGAFAFAADDDFYETVDFGVDSQTSTFLAGLTSTTLAAVSTGNDLAETATPTYLLGGISADALANSDTVFATDNAAAPSQSATTPVAPAVLQHIGIDKTNPRLTGIAGPADLSANAGGVWTVSFADTAVAPAGPSGFAADPVRVKLERIISTGTTCRNPDTGASVSCTTAGGFVAEDGTVAINGGGVEAYYRITARVRDQAGNVSADSSRVTLIDVTNPITGGVVAPSTIVGGQATVFSASAQDNVDLGDVQAAIDYGLAVLGYPRSAIGAGYGPEAFEISTNASVTINSFIRSIQGTSAVVPIGLPTGAPSAAATVQFDVRDAAGAKNNVPCPGPNNCVSSPIQAISANVNAGGAPVGFGDLNTANGLNAEHGLFVHATPSEIVVCNSTPGAGAGQPCPTNEASTTLSATATGPNATFANPFSRVEFYWTDAGGRLQLIPGGVSVSATDNTVAGKRTWSYTLVWNPGTSIPAIATDIVALGIRANGDALLSQVQNITIAID